MQVERAEEILASAALDHPGAFFGPAAGLALGTGLVVDKVEFAAFNTAVDRFTVKGGLVLVLSHECDLDKTNERMLNDMAIICPIVSIESVIQQASQDGVSDEYVSSFLGNLATRAVSRAVYVPPLPSLLPIGGLLYLNLLTSTATSRLEQGTRTCALSAFALTVVDYALERHLRRPKTDELPLQRATLRNSSTRENRQPRP